MVGWRVTWIKSFVPSAAMHLSAGSPVARRATAMSFTIWSETTSITWEAQRYVAANGSSFIKEKVLTDWDHSSTISQNRKAAVSWTTLCCERTKRSTSKPSSTSAGKRPSICLILISSPWPARWAIIWELATTCTVRISLDTDEGTPMSCAKRVHGKSEETKK